jgi:transitional endoplasmic reticulum ATPase
MRKLISQLLVEFDALTADVAVLVIGATNRPQRIDTSLLRPGRFDHLIYIPPPSGAERADILRLYASRLKVESAEQLDSIVALAHTPASHNLTGADLKQLCNRAALQAAMRGGQSVSEDDFRAALSTMRSSLTMDDINQVAQWRRSTS